MAVIAVVVVPRLLPLVCSASNKDRLRSATFLKYPRLLFCRPVPYCVAAEVLGEGSGLAV